MTKRNLGHMFTLLMISTIIATVSFAQGAGNATLTGLVTDQQGGVISNVTVVARRVDTGTERTTNTTSDGLYRFGNLAPAVYNVRVEAQGFAKAEANGLKLQVGEQRDLNFTLSASGTSITVDVTAAPLVEVTKTDVSSVVTDKEVATLPVTGAVGNDYANLALSAPGVRMDSSGNSGDLLGPGQINNRGNLYNVDGGNIADQVVSTRDALGASIEEVKEFQVLSNNYNAEYGQAGGLIINVITKSGTNGFHGDGHMYFRGRNLAASNFFYNLSDAAAFRRAPFHKREGGFTAGGPFVKERTFWFVSYEQTSQASPLTLVPPTGTITVPQPVHELLFSARIDQQITRNHLFTARFNEQRDFFDNLLVQIANNASPESLVSSSQSDHTFNLALTSTLTPHLLNEGRFFWHRLRSATPDKSSQPGVQGPNFYFGAAFCCPQAGLQHRYQYIDNLSWTHGAHTVKTGFNISHFPYFSLFQQFHFGQYRGLKAFPNIGSPTSFVLGVGKAEVNSSDDIYGFYAQDTWKVKPSLTINYGLRYDVESGAFTGGTIKASVRGGCVQGNGIIPACSSDHNNFQPRFGLAWSPRYENGFLHTLFGDPGRTTIRVSMAEVTELAFLNVVLDSLNFDGLNLFTVTITNPSVLKFFPNAPSASALAPFIPTTRTAFGRVRPISNDLKNPETRHANLTIERQIGRDLVLDIGWTGVYGFGLFGERDRNFPTINADPAHPGFFYLGPRPDARFTAVRTNENSRTSHYEGAFIQAKKRLSHHSYFNVSYSYSKLIASTEDFYGLSEPGDPRNIKAERALAYNDIRHLVNFGAVFDTEGLTKNRMLGHIVDNWTMGIIGSVQSARPYPISTGDSPFANAFFPGLGSETQQRPNVLADGTIVATNLANGGAGTNLLVSQAGAPVCKCPQTTFLAPAGASALGPSDTFTGDPVDFQFLNGNMARNLGVGAPFWRFDLSFIKAFHIREQMRLELKVDAFNILNKTNFQSFNGLNVLNDMSVGLKPDGTADPNCRLCLNAITGRYIGSDGRVLKLQDLQHGRVSKDLQNGIFNGLGDPTAADIPRTLQLSFRFRW